MDLDKSSTQELFINMIIFKQQGKNAFYNRVKEYIEKHRGIPKNKIDELIDYLQENNLFDYENRDTYKKMEETIKEFISNWQDKESFKNPDLNKSSMLDCFCKYKGITREEYKILRESLSEELEIFVESFADKYPANSIKKENFDVQLINFVNEELNKEEYKITYPLTLFQVEDVSLIKYQNEDKNFYSVDINNGSIGMSILFSENLEEAVKVYDKEKLFSKIQKANDEKIYTNESINSIYGSDLNKVFVFDEEIFRKTS